MLASSLHDLHFQQFLTQSEFNVEFRKDLLNWVYGGNERNGMSSVLKDMTKRYATFCDETLDGTRGKLLNIGCNTAYWSICTY